MNEPYTLTEAIGRVIPALQPLGWTDVIYPRVQDQDRRTTGQDKADLVPMAYVGNNEYTDARPNDERGSVLFFRVVDPEKSDYDRTRFSPPHRIRARRNVTLIGWVNLDKLPAFNDQTGFTEQIKIDLKRALKYVPCVVAIGDYQDGKLSEVFKGYRVSDLDRKYDRMPFACFSLQLTLMMIEPN